MRKIGIITSTRAEFGLLLPVIKEFRKNENQDFKVELIVTGTHLSEKYGMTVNEILSYNLRIDEKIKIKINNKNEKDISDNMADTLRKFTNLFTQKKYNAILVLGDRYEMLSISISALLTKIPIFHMCGGDTTEGAIDECIRHSITKMSYLHFVTNDESYHRVIQLGENPNRVFNVGSTSIDNILSQDLLSKKEALKSIGLSDCRYALCTYHPVTLDDTTPEILVNELLEAVKETPGLEFIITKTNSDQGGSLINDFLEKKEMEIKNLHVYDSLGVYRYLSLMKSAECVVGNSSSGIIEAPALKVPTVNIGDRQKGRLQSKSIINTDPDKESIKSSVDKALEPEFKKICNNICSPYGKGDTAQNIVKISMEKICQEINLKKVFYDIDWRNL